MDRRPDAHPPLLDLTVDTLGARPRRDDHVFLLASTRWRECRQQWLALMADSPDVRGCLGRWIQQQLNLDAERVGLRFFATDERGEHFVSLLQVCAYLQQQPTASEDFDTLCVVAGVQSDVSTVPATPTQLLAQLKGLDLHGWLSQQWNTWWAERAPGTALSRWARAVELFRGHFDAAAQLAFAQGQISAAQLHILQALAEPTQHPQDSNPITTARLGGQAVLQDAQWPAALVITLDAGSLLYLPARQSALQSFEQRSALEADLRRERLSSHPAGTEAPPSLLADSVAHDPLLAAVTRWRSHCLEAQLERVRLIHVGTLAEQGATVLDDADEWDRQRRTEAFFASPPEPAEWTESGAEDGLPLFGSLGADVPEPQRRQALAQQQHAIETLLDDAEGVPDRSRLAPLQDQLDLLHRAEEDARTAVTGLLARSPATRLLELRQRPNAHYDGLYRARLAGLRAEAAVQGLLRQISADEQRWVDAVLDHPERTERRSAVACFSLAFSDSTEGRLGAYQTLDGPLVITGGEPGHSLLLYWPGTAGGLQRFASRQALEHAVFKLHAIDAGLTLHLTRLDTDPFEQGLQNQLYACEQQIAQLLADYPVPQHEEQRRIELDKYQLETLDTLGVPVHEAREQAYADILEQQQTHALAGHLPHWLGHASSTERTRLKASIKAFIAAMKDSHALIERDLPHRDDFGRRRVDERLRQDFSLEQSFSVSLDVPDSTTWQKTLVEGAAPGTPQKNVLVASAARSRLTIADLAQLNIDQSVWWRIALMKVEVSADSATERATLTKGITASYLRTLVTELDLAGHYEQLIFHAFMGSSSASAFSNAHRRECLTQPFRLMLQMQGDSALLQGHLDRDGWQMLRTAIDAATVQAFSTEGRRIALLPASLTVGGADTGDGETGLSGITFIQEQVSGVTLLYLPDSPDGRFFYQKATLRLAREQLFNLCLRPEMVTYLAGRALIGDPARHISRINQARQINFDALIGVGSPWPATTSLAAHLLNAHMGRLIEAHRATSRSNTALYLEQYGLQGGAMFNYLKMAMGMLPFVGTAIALYDAWDSANLSVSAFLRGDVGHGLAQLESVLLSLIDAAMDILPGAAARPTLARALTRQRQASIRSGSARLRRASLRSARRRHERFEGYAYEGDISLVGLTPVSEGLYRQVYRHPLGDFILHQGRVYQVRLLGRTMRLYGTRLRAYQQPIALDAAGHWDTYFAVHGTLYDLGLSGGGNLVGHLADGLDPIWPDFIRRALPRWLTDRAARHQRRLENTIDALSLQIHTQHHNNNAAILRYYDSDDPARRLMLDSVDAGCAHDIELAAQRYARASEVLPLSRGNRRQDTQEILSQSSMIVVERTVHRCDFGRERCLNYLADINGITEQMSQLPPGSMSGYLHHSRQIRSLRLQLLTELQRIDGHMEQLNLWRRRISVRQHKSSVAQDVERLESLLSEASRDYIKALNHLPMVTHFDQVFDASWFYLHERMAVARGKVFEALNSQNSLPDVIANVTRRNQVLAECLEVYQAFARDLKVWAAGYPQHFDSPWLAPTLEQLDKMSRHARHVIKNGVKQSANARNSGKEIFETEGHRLLIGQKEVDPVTRQIRFTMTGEDGRVENWLPASAGQYRRQVPAGPAQSQIPADRQVLVSEARQRLAALDDYRLKVDGYARQHMLPADLEYMMTGEAAELRLRARRIARVAAQEPLIAQLDAKARELVREGRELRIAQTLKSQTPTEGYLDYLHLEAPPGQPIIEIRKLGTLVDLGRRADGRPDFLQEFEVLDLSQGTPRVLWYAHFHFSSAHPVFARFDKAHLKTPAQRHRGLKWQQKQADSGAAVDPIWRGPIGKPLASRYFEALF